MDGMDRENGPDWNLNHPRAPVPWGLPWSGPFRPLFYVCFGKPYSLKLKTLDGMNHEKKTPSSGLRTASNFAI